MKGSLRVSKLGEDVCATYALGGRSFRDVMDGEEVLFEIKDYEERTEGQIIAELQDKGRREAEKRGIMVCQW